MTRPLGPPIAAEALAILLIGGALAAWAGDALASDKPAPPVCEGPITGVTDGDNWVIDCGDGRTLKARWRDRDAPELHRPKCLAERLLAQNARAYVALHIGPLDGDGDGYEGLTVHWRHDHWSGARSVGDGLVTWGVWRGWWLTEVLEHQAALDGVTLWREMRFTDAGRRIDPKPEWCGRGR